MTALNSGSLATLSANATGWAAAPLIDAVNMLQWTEDLAADQVRAILRQVPLDSRRNAAEVLSAIRQGDLPAARRQAHRLKGMAANIGAQRLAEIARDIEYGAEADADLDTLVAALSTVLEDTLVAIAAVAT